MGERRVVVLNLTYPSMRSQENKGRKLAMPPLTHEAFAASVQQSRLLVEEGATLAEDGETSRRPRASAATNEQQETATKSP